MTTRKSHRNGIVFYENSYIALGRAGQNLVAAVTPPTLHLGDAHCFTSALNRRKLSDIFSAAVAYKSIRGLTCYMTEPVETKQGYRTCQLVRYRDTSLQIDGAVLETRLGKVIVVWHFEATASKYQKKTIDVTIQKPLPLIGSAGNPAYNLRQIEAKNALRILEGQSLGGIAQQIDEKEQTLIIQAIQHAIKATDLSYPELAKYIGLPSQRSLPHDQTSWRHIQDLRRVLRQIASGIEWDFLVSSDRVIIHHQFPPYFEAEFLHRPEAELVIQYWYGASEQRPQRDAIKKWTKLAALALQAHLPSSKLPEALGKQINAALTKLRLDD